MKTLLRGCIWLLFLSFTTVGNPHLQWLRENLTTVQSAYGGNELPYTITKTYTFYDSAFVIRTEKVFEDKELNGPLYFSKVRYKDIIRRDTTGIGKAIGSKNSVSEESCADFLYFNLEVANLYTAAGREPAANGRWLSLNEATSLELYLPTDKELSTGAMQKLIQLASGF
ncbi:hypothetical protein [Pseudoflavitalea rhizosphaerae]|uniref:hypothetical protein n=1 Tax=Pseudoflavitalea rhizosphaerae TaxID=1884793 RepID=UPI000F8F4A42|nr:hypothetical protein [Pseudoflavitalea rhizosphaerae]